MSLNAKTLPKSNNSKFTPAEPLEAGSYPGRVVQIIDFGVQEQNPYKGQAKPPAHIIGVTYELSDEFMKDEEGNDVEDKPRWVSEDFPFHPLDRDMATSTKRYRALDPEDAADGDFTKLISCPGMISIIQRPHNGKVYNNVAGVASVRAKDAARMPELVNPPKVFMLDEPDLEIFNSFPEFIQTKIKKNLNYQGSALQKLLGGSTGASKPEASTVVEDDDNNAPETTEEDKW
jgi:hypothetical protein